MEFAGRQHRFLFTVNVIDDLQEHYNAPLGDILNMIVKPKPEEKVKVYSVLRRVIKSLTDDSVEGHNDLSSEKWEYLSERAIGRLITPANKAELVDLIFATFKGSLPSPKENEADPPTSGQ